MKVNHQNLAISILISPHFMELQVTLMCVISSFRREVHENCALLGYYGTSGGNSLPTFLDHLSVLSCHPYRRFRTTYKSYLVLTDVSGPPIGPILSSLPTFQDHPPVLSCLPYRRFRTTYRSYLVVLPDISGQPETSARNYQYSLRNDTAERSSHFHWCIHKQPPHFLLPLNTYPSGSK